MSARSQFSLFACYTLFKKELARFSKVWLQTLFAPMITSMLYLLVFGHVLDGRVEVFAGVSYTAFLIPGLLMMAVMQNSFANTSSSLIQSKVMGSLIFVMLPPISIVEFYLAYISAAIVRGCAVGLGVLMLAIFYADLSTQHYGIVVLFVLLASYSMAALGMIAGIWAEKFDQVATFQNFIIIPFTFLSGVFYSIQSLPKFWYFVSQWNPFFYMIDGFRYGFFGISDKPVYISLAVVSLLAMSLTCVCLMLLKNGYKLRDA